MRALNGAVAVALAWTLSACGGKSSTPAGAGTLTLLAGALGGPGQEDGVGADARFQTLTAVVNDDPNTLYLADSGFIRRLDISSREVSTLWHQELDEGVASGASGARYSGAQGLASDGHGNLYFADASNHNIRRLERASGSFTTIAGAAGISGATDGVGAAARFYSPADVACDRAGTLFVSDTENGTVRQIELESGTVTTLAGSPGATQSRDGVGAAASLLHPSGLAQDGRGKLYVEDDLGIRQIVIATGEVSTVSRWSQWGAEFAFVFPAPGTLAWDAASGALYFANWGSTRVVQIELGSGAPTSLAGKMDSPFLSHGFHFADGAGEAAQFSGPRAISADNEGQLYVADGCTVRRLDETSGAVSTLAGLPSAYGSTDGSALDARFTVPSGLVSDAQGNLFIAGGADYTIRRIAADTGEVTTIAGSPYLNGADAGIGSEARFNQPDALALDGAGNLYVADGNAVRKIELATATVSDLVPPPQSSEQKPALHWARALALDGAGHLYVADNESSLYKIVLATGEFSLFAGGSEMRGNSDGALASARFSYPRGLASDGASALYVADSNNHTIRKIELDTERVTTFAGSPELYGIEDGIGPAARFERPGDLAYDGHDSLYVIDGTTIRRIELANARVTTVVGTPLRAQVKLGALPGGLVEPSGLAVLPSGDLAIASEQAILRARF